MSHVLGKRWPGKSEVKKTRLAEAITTDVAAILDSGDASISVALEEVAPTAWQEQVYEPDVAGKAATLYKKPGYGSADLQAATTQQSAMPHGPSSLRRLTVGVAVADRGDGACRLPGHWHRAARVAAPRPRRPEIRQVHGGPGGAGSLGRSHL